MSNDLRETMADMVQYGCPTTTIQVCLYCHVEDTGAGGEQEIDHLNGCPWPTLAEEANA